MREVRATCDGRGAGACRGTATAGTLGGGACPVVTTTLGVVQFVRSEKTWGLAAPFKGVA